jgi:hypothetical protein
LGKALQPRINHLPGWNRRYTFARRLLSYQQYRAQRCAKAGKSTTETASGIEYKVPGHTRKRVWFSLTVPAKRGKPF